MELWKRYFTSDPVTATEATHAFVAIGDYESIPQYLSHLPASMLSYYGARGEFETVLNTYPDMRHPQVSALMHSGQFERVLRDYADMRAECGQALLRLGRIEEAKQTYADIPSVVAHALLLQGAYDKVIERYPKFGWGELTSYILSQRFDEFNAKYEAKTLPRERYQATMSAALLDYINGEKRSAITLMEKERQKPLNYLPNWAPHMFEVFFQYEVLQSIEGDAEVLRRALTSYAKMPYHVKQRLAYTARLLLGEIDEAEFMAQPDKLALRARYLFYKGIALELTDKPQAALKQYQAFLHLDAYEREMDQAVLIFARWRIEQLCSL